MSLMGTLAKLAIGYAAARGVDKMSGGGGVGALFGGAQIAPDDAQADQAPGVGNMQDMMAQMGGGAGMGGVQDMISQMTKGGGMGNMQEMIQNMASQAGFDLSALTGGGSASASDKGGLLSSQPESGPGLAGVLAALGGAAAMSGQGAGAMIDQFNTSETAPQAEEVAGLMLRAMIQAAKSDGEIDSDEQAKIMDTVGADANADDISFVRAQLAAPVDVESLAADTPEPLKGQVYSMSLMSIRLDRQSEAEYLDSLARALGLNQQAVNALHLQMGVQPLYS
ncbi:MAG: DUF533 domain-containing protein [Sedimentitalea sp.]|uniref:DUF533 domain-containing protein n=1 Tax=Sedimentitalea sp. TaxID=2048915 RepID=UPI0032672B9A